MGEQRAGNTKVEEIYINTSSGESIDLFNFYMEINLSESIYQNALMGSVVINDAANLLVKGLIIGKDSITFKLKTPSFKDTPENVIHKTFYIYSVADRTLNADREQFYTLHFMSLEALQDSITVLSKKFKGGTDIIAQELFENVKSHRILDDKSKPIGEKIPLSIGDTPHASNNFEFIASQWSPFKCLNYLARNTVGNTKRMPNVMFWESNKGYFFSSITHITESQKEGKILYDEYSYINNLDENENNSKDNRMKGEYSYTSPFISSRMLTAEKVYYPIYFDQLQNSQSGYYANRTVSYDWTTKDIFDIEFDYTDNHADRKSQIKNLIPDTFSSFKHIAKNQPFASKPFSNSLNALTYKAGASNLFGKDSSFDINQVVPVSFRKTAMAELEAVKLEITVPGKTDVEVGRLIRFNFPYIGDKTNTPDRSNVWDPLVSGIYIIVGIHHQVTKVGHSMLLEIVRDSMGEEA
tara:strand:+ start:636 stop:2039 length:1404 start_codon:yes stop_codon:yes gene_type:complete